MHPTLRHCLETTSRFVASLLPQGLRSTRAKARRRLKPELAALEERKLLYFSVTAMAVPDLLWPPNQKFVPVTISGTAREFAIEGNKQVFKNLPGPKKANFQVVDEYRQDEPAGPVTLTHVGGGKYTFSFTTHLQARRAEEFAAGRRYYIIVGARDDDGWGAKVVPVQVPRSPNDRGPAPLQPGPPRNQARTNGMIHPKGVGGPRHRS